MGELRDQFNRQFHYLRLSVTDVCNFKCAYCLPNGYKKDCQDQVLSVQEIENLVRAFAKMGFWKVRLTGGEPTVREDIVEIVERISRVPGIRFVALSTNGWKLSKLVDPLYRAGLRGLNVSIDSFDPAKFQTITGKNNLSTVLGGVERALATGFEKVKVNTVLLKGLNAMDLPEFLKWVRCREVTLRFIELMRTADNKTFFDQHHVAGDSLIKVLNEFGWNETERVAGAGPAREFKHPDSQGGIGVIAPYSKDFCSTCNRLRVSSQGNLKLCLFGEGHYELRPWIQRADQSDQVIAAVQSVLGIKKPSHYLNEGNYGDTRNLSSIGG